MAMFSVTWMAVGLDLLLQLAQQLIEIRRGLGRRHDQRHGVDAGGQILHVDVVALQHLQNTAQEPSSEDMPFLVMVMTEKSFFPAMPVIKLRELLRLVVERLADHRAGVLRLVRVADVQGMFFSRTGKIVPSWSTCAPM